MNSVVSRAIVNGNGINCDQSRVSGVKKLPCEFFYQGSGSQPSISYQNKIKWKNSSANYDNLKKSHFPLDSKKIISRSSSNDVSQLNRTQNDSLLENSRSSFHASDPQKKSINKRSILEPKKSKIGRIESTESIIEIHKFFKEKNIYSDPSDNYKRRTIVLVKGNHSSSGVSSGSSSRNSHNFDSFHNSSNSDFGFHLQSYGLINTTTKLTEFICFVDNVQPGSPAKHAGLNNGDVLLAIDGIPINEFTNLHEIIKHVKGKNELRIVVMCENVCKKIKLQQRLESIKAKLSSRKEQLERLNKQQEAILNKKDTFNSFLTSPLSSSTSSSMTNSSISESHLFPISPSYNNSSQCNDTNLLSPELSQNSNMLVKNSTPYDMKNAFILSPEINFDENSNLRPSRDREDYNNKPRDSNEIIEINVNSSQTRPNKSSSSPNGTARIQVDLNLDLTSPIIPTSSSSYSTYSSSSSASTSTNSSGTTQTVSSGSTLHKTRQLAHKCIQQTSKIVRSASSSSMNLISKLNRSSRSRNSSICSANLNNTIDVSDSKNTVVNIQKSLDKFNSSESISKTDSHKSKVLTDSTNSPSKSFKLAKNTSLSTENKQHSPRMINPPSVRSSLSQQPANFPTRHSMLSKFHNTNVNNLENCDSKGMADISMANQQPVSKSSVYRFSVLQNKPIKKERFKSLQPIVSVQSNRETLNQTEPLFSPVQQKHQRKNANNQSNQSSLLNEIIDSGIDVGIGLAVSPNNSGVSSYSEGKQQPQQQPPLVAKVMSDGGYSSFINDFSIKNITYADENRSVKKESLIEDNTFNKLSPMNLKTINLNDDYFITKL